MVLWIKSIRELETVHTEIACNMTCLICREKVPYPMNVENLDSLFSPKSANPNLFVGREDEIYSTGADMVYICKKESYLLTKS